MASEQPDPRQNRSRESDMPPSLYWTQQVRSAIVRIPDPPPVLWVTFQGDKTPQAAYLLTPATYARLWRTVSDAEDKWAKGKYPEPQMREAWERWAAVERFAAEHLDEVEVLRAKAAAARGQIPKLPSIPPMPWCPW